jgi:hypothetical protein
LRLAVSGQLGEEAVQRARAAAEDDAESQAVTGVASTRVVYHNSPKRSIYSV